MGKQWVVYEGYLLTNMKETVDSEENNLSPTTVLNGGRKYTSNTKQGLKERYFILWMNRKLEIYDSKTKDICIEVVYVRGFCGWDGDGLLKVDAYGLELKIERRSSNSTANTLHLAAFNRLELEKWCRGLTAALDPNSAAGEEVRKERRKLKREEKKIALEQQQKLQKLREHREKLAEEEKLRLIAREEEISNMTPLERVDGLGSLDDDTARVLEMRKLRLQRRQANAASRVNKTAYRRRMEEGVGGKVENIQPLPSKTVEQRNRVRVELPPPGQFFEIGSESKNIASKSRNSRSISSASGSTSSKETFGSNESRRSSVHSNSGAHFVPPPPPSLHHSLTSTSSEYLLSNLSTMHTLQSPISNTTSSPINESTDRKATTSFGRRDLGLQDSLAAILMGKAPSSTPDNRTHEEDTSQNQYKLSETNNFDAKSITGRKRPVVKNEVRGRMSMSRSSQISVVASEDETTSVTSTSNYLNGSNTAKTKRNRKREKQLSAERKSLLNLALSTNNEVINSKPNRERKGLFDDSSSEEEEISYLQVLSTDRSSRETSQKPSKLDRQFENQSHLSNKYSKDYNTSGSSISGSDDEPLNQASKPLLTQTINPERGTIAGTVSSEGISVVYDSFSMVFRKYKAVAQFTFKFVSKNSSNTVTFSKTYSEFEEMHTRISAIVSSLPKSTEKFKIPKFPPKHVLRNNLKPENVVKRAHEFVAYFQELITIPGLLENSKFQQEVNLEPSFLNISANGSIKGANNHQLRKDNRSVRQSNMSRSSNTEKRPFWLEDDDDDVDDDDREDRGAKSPLHYSSQNPTKSTSTKTNGKKIFSPHKTISPNNKSSFQGSLESISILKHNRRKKSTKRSSGSIETTPASIDNNSSSKALPVKVTGLEGCPNPFAGGRGDLLAAIRQGKALNKVSAPGDNENATTNATGDTNTKAHMENTNSSSHQVSPPTQTGGSINDIINTAIASRRIQVEYDENSSSDSDDDW